MKSKRIYSVEHDTVCHRCLGTGYIVEPIFDHIMTVGSEFATAVHIGESGATCDECNGTGVIQRPAPEQERP